MIKVIAAIPRLVRDLVPGQAFARRLVTIVALQAISVGVFFTCAPILLVRCVGLRPSQVAIGVSAAAFAGMISSPWFGRVSDQVASRRNTLVLLYILTGMFYAAYCFATSFWYFLLVACLIGIIEAGCAPVRTALIYDLLPGASGSHVRAQMRSWANLGVGAGALIAAVPLAYPTRFTFCVLVLALAANSCLAGMQILSLPNASRETALTQRSRVFWAAPDLRFLAVTALNGLLEFHHPILTIALPLWVATKTAAPSWIVAGLLFVNTSLVVITQVRASRRCADFGAARAMLRRSGLIMAGACVILSLTFHTNSTIAIGVLFLGVVGLTAAEVLQTAASYELSVAFAPEDRLGEYQGIFGLSHNVQQLLGPIVATSLLLTWGTFGWYFLAAGFTACSMVAGALLRPLRHVGNASAAV